MKKHTEKHTEKHTSLKELLSQKWSFPTPNKEFGEKTKLGFDILRCYYYQNYANI